MSLTVGELNARLRLDQKDFDRGLDSAGRKMDGTGRKADGVFDRIGRTAQRAATLVGVYFAFDTVKGFISGTINAASDLNETVNKGRVVFGASSADIVSWSKKSATSFGLSQQAALAATAQFGDMFQQLGFTQQASADASKNLVQMAADLGSFHNVDPSDVLDRIAASLRGEYDSLQQLIPNINAARVEQEALAMTGKSSAAALTAQEKAQATLSIIQRDGARAAGDFANTSAEAANKQRILAAQVRDTQAAIGQKLLPAYKALLGISSDVVQSTGQMAVGFLELPAPVQASAAALVAWLVLGNRVRGVVGGATKSLSDFAAQVAHTAAEQRAAQVAGRQLVDVEGSLLNAAQQHRVQLMGEASDLRSTIREKTAAANASTGLAGVLGRLGAQYQEAGTSGQRFGRSLAVATAGVGALKIGATGLIGALGGPWGIAIAGGAALLALFASRSAAAKARQQEQTNAIRDFAEALKESSGAITDNVRQMAAQKLEQSGVLKTAEQLGLSLGKIGDAALGDKPALAGLNAELDEIIRNGLIVSGDSIDFTPEAKAAQDLKVQLNAASGEIGKAAASNKRLEETTAGSTGAAKKGAAAQGILAQTARTLADAGAKAEDKIKALHNALDSLNSTENDTRAAQAAFIEQLQGPVKEAFKGHKVAIDKTTGALKLNAEAGRNQQAALIDANQIIGESLEKVYSQALESGKGQQEAAAMAIRSYNEQRAALVRQLTQMTGNRRVAELLAKTYLATPKQIETLFGQPGMSKALADAARLDLQVRQIPGTHDVAIIAKTDAAAKKLRDLGYTVKRLPDGSIGVVLTGAGGVESQLNRLTRPRTVNIRAVQTSLAGVSSSTKRLGDALTGHAAGGEVRGPGTTTSDSIPALLSNREWIINAASAQKVGGAALAYINRHGRLPRMAAGGPVGGTGAAGGALVAELSPRAEQMLTAVANRPVRLEAAGKELARVVRAGQLENDYQG